MSPKAAWCLAFRDFLKPSGDTYAGNPHKYRNGSRAGIGLQPVSEPYPVLRPQVWNARVLPPAFFRSHLTVDSLGLGCVLPICRAGLDFLWLHRAPISTCAQLSHEKSRSSTGSALLFVFFVPLIYLSAIHAKSLFQPLCFSIPSWREIMEIITVIEIGE